jgi:hypothetical protein
MTAAAQETVLFDFVTAKFAGADGYFTAWVKGSNLTRSFPAKNVSALVAYLDKASASEDVYLAISMQINPPAGGKRGGEATVSCLSGLFSDIDFADAKGAQTGYPKDETEALTILADLPLRPTWIIASGNGLQAHFDFDVPWRLATPADRKAAKELSTAFQRFILAHFRAHGRKIDSVGDIVRNFRPPGTLNHKSVPPKPVRLLSHDPSSRHSLKNVESLTKAAVGAARADNTRQAKPAADHRKIVSGCAWYREIVVNGAGTCAEPDWFAGASIAALCRDGETEFLNYSRRHPDFDDVEARDKFKRAVAHGAPRTCTSIAEDLGHESICKACPHQGKVATPLQLGRRGFDPGSDGPLPLGYTQEGYYVFLDQARQILIVTTSSQLLTIQFLIGIRPMAFWAERFPSLKKGGHFDAWGAGQTLMEACRQKGPFDPRKVRGRGVWLEGSRIILNFGGPIPVDVKSQYLCFEPLPLAEVDRFDTDRLKRMLACFNWRNPQDATLLLGWLAIAPICGVLNWRPHCFVYGPPNCGKSTLHQTASNLLRPLGLSADGQSSEAGIRQLIKADSRPCILDEFESDQVRSHLAGVIRLARSASSSESPVLRGTPEGKAMQFMLRTCFFFAAVNPSGIGSADATRILLFEMLKHENDRDVAAQIAEHEAYFADRGPEWCGYMAKLAHLIPRSIELFKKALPGLDSRHRLNVATLLAGAFLAGERVVPTSEQALAMAEAFKPSIDLHAVEFERDDAAECLTHLLGFQVETETLGTWLAAALADKKGAQLPFPYKDGGKRITPNFDIVIRDQGNEPGLFLRHGSPAIERIFKETKWARGAWEKALRKLDGYFPVTSPIHFASQKIKSRAIGLPLEYLPDIELESDKPLY